MSEPEKSSCQPPADPGARALLDLLATSRELALVGYAVDGRITLFNPGAERLFGYRADRVTGFAGHRMLHEEGSFPDVFQPDGPDLPPVRELDTQVLTRTGDLLPVRVTLHRLQAPLGGVLVLALYRDLSGEGSLRGELEQLREHASLDARQTEREAEFLRELLRHTVETVQIGLAVQELQSGMMAYVNDGFEKITGLRNMEIMGRTLDDVLADYPDARTRLVAFTGRIRESARGEAAAPDNGNWELELPSGRRMIEVYGRPIIVEGHSSQYILLIIEDNTERQRLQLQLVQSEKLAAVGQLAAGIAHEIRNPLNTIYSALFDLSEIIANPSPEAAEDIAISMEEIKRVQDIINNLLDFARESERSTGRADLNDVVQKTGRLVQHDLSNKRIEIVYELGDVPAVAISNNALKQILINLVTNAADAMPRGGKLSIRTFRRRGQVPLHQPSSSASQDALDTGSFRLAEISAHRSRRFSEGVYAEHAVLEINDTGTGIPASILPNIFNPFFTTKPPGSGTGLGLSVVHSLVQDAGGAASVKSEPGMGTTFTIELPVIANADEA